jgi:hypothetical protein
MEPVFQHDPALIASKHERLLPLLHVVRSLGSRGKIRRGQRLIYHLEGRTILKKDLITDGPFGQSKGGHAETKRQPVFATAPRFKLLR